MIFKKLFKKKKWLSEKVSERLAAVAELDIDENGNKAVLHELAFNDGDEKVRRATLEKLNDFSLWYQAFKNEDSEAIKRVAEKSLVAQLTVKGSNLEPSLKQKFIQECNKTALLEQVVFQLNDDALSLEVLKRLDKDNLTLKGITDSPLSQTSKLALLDDVTDNNQLKKLAKKLDGALLEKVEEKIDTLRLRAEQPIKLEKQARLLLAQLNALKDKQDFEQIQQKQQALVQEWQSLSSEFSILTADIKRELNEKFDKIEASLARILAPLKAAWQAEQEQAKRDEARQVNKTKLEQRLIEIESQVSAAVAQDKEIDQEAISRLLSAVATDTDQTDLNEEDKTAIAQRTASLLTRAEQVPQIKSAIGKAQLLLEQLKELDKPSDFKTLNSFASRFKELEEEWSSNLKQVGISLPTELEKEYAGLSQAWRQARDDLSREQKQLFSQARRKLSELEGLIRFGKFHNAFGLYKKLSFWMEDLNEYQQGQLARKWQTAQEEIEKLHELEKSFSNPKKQELLQGIKKIAEHPLPDPGEQAHRVRLLRSNWQSLGHAGDEQEVALNEEFDQLCEQAFSPCRDHYKALEDERRQNLDAKRLIIEQLQTLAENLKNTEVASWRDLESVFVRLTRLWRETGHVDREKVAEVNKAYQNAVAPVKEAIAQHHKDNEAQKRKLIENAEAIVAQDLVLAQKTEQLKALQAKWQKVGFAGKSQDQKLWNAFRAVNEPVFQQRDEARKSEQAQELESLGAVLEQLQTLSGSLADAGEIAQFRAVIEEANSAFNSVSGLSKPNYEKLRKRHTALVKEAEEGIVSLRLAQEKQVYLDLFAAIEALVNGKAAEIASLKPSWQSAINGSSKGNRQELTLMLEITAGVESPEPLKEQRNQVQMTMLSNKLEQGIEPDVHDLLEQWLAAGIFESDDLALAARIKPIFLN